MCSEAGLSSRCLPCLRCKIFSGFCFAGVTFATSSSARRCKNGSSRVSCSFRSGRQISYCVCRNFLNKRTAVKCALNFKNFVTYPLYHSFGRIITDKYIRVKIHSAGGIIIIYPFCEIYLNEHLPSVCVNRSVGMIELTIHIVDAARRVNCKKIRIT